MILSPPGSRSFEMKEEQLAKQSVHEKVADQLGEFAEQLTSEERRLLGAMLGSLSGEAALGSFRTLVAELSAEAAPHGAFTRSTILRSQIANWMRKGSHKLLRLTSLGFDRGPHVTRYLMYQRLAGLGTAMAQGAPVLSISDSQPLCRILGFSDGNIVNVSYPEVSITSLPFEDASFDSIVSDQVLEHVRGNPQVAIDESFRVLRPGGIAVHTTCFINPIHNVPGDFWRFTPAGLALMVSPHGRVLEVGGWGNLWAWPYIWLGMRYEPIPHARWHPFHWIATHNSAGWPISTWVVARKVR
ncbi:MAG TPA: methyltransferase domain-containing protein [Thermoanaerobaculia bacterium]|nr:methyltransferase domain-containing protein [Thermoanaerobaculia bacterium]